WNAASMRARAGSELSPPTRMPLIETPAGIARVGVDAGAAAHASPAMTTVTASVRRTRCTRRRLEQVSRAISRIPSDAGRTLVSRMASGPWQLAPCSYADVAQLAAALDLDDVTAAVLVRRQLADPEDARRFLDGAPPGHDPLRLGDMAAAVEAITAAVA